jgi:hypothetical protein
MIIKNDIRNYPHLFQIIKESSLANNNMNLSVPQDLMDFWIDFGFGEMFETETIYSPFTDNENYSIKEINDFFMSRGLSTDFCVFHTGINISAFRIEEPCFVLLEEDSFEILESFYTFDEWYNKTLRAEYFERYSMN